MNIQQAEINAGLRLADPPDLSAVVYEPKADPLRVKWINNLRSVVEKRMPRNKSGSAVISDVDLLFATDDERKKTLEMTLK